MGAAGKEQSAFFSFFHFGRHNGHEFAKKLLSLGIRHIHGFFIQSIKNHNNFTGPKSLYNIIDLYILNFSLI